MTDRRAFLAAALVSSVALAAPAIATPSPFPAALAEYRHARSEFERIASIGDDDAANVAGNVSDAAFEAMLTAPARHGADLATKLEILMFEYTDCILDEDRLRLIVTDARRLGERGQA